MCRTTVNHVIIIQVIIVIVQITCIVKYIDFKNIIIFVVGLVIGLVTRVVFLPDKLRKFFFIA